MRSLWQRIGLATYPFTRLALLHWDDLQACGRDRLGILYLQIEGRKS